VAATMFPIKVLEKMQKCRLRNQKMILRRRKKKKPIMSSSKTRPISKQLSWRSKRFDRRINNLQILEKIVNQINQLKINSKMGAGIKSQS